MNLFKMSHTGSASTDKYSSIFLIGIGVMLFTVSFFDIKAEGRIAVPLFYLAVIFLVYVLSSQFTPHVVQRRRLILVITALCSLMTLLTLFIASTANVHFEIIYFNRLIYVCAFWMTACLLITQLKSEERVLHASDERKIMLKEIHHRVKNNLQIISSLFSLESRATRSEETQSILKDSFLRINSISLVHDILYSSEDLSRIDFGNYVRALVKNIISNFTKGNALKINVFGNATSINMDTAILCGLIINELVANSLRHAFLLTTGIKEEGPSLAITIEQNDETLLITVVDDGAGISKSTDPLSSETMGFKIIKTLLKQLKATMNVDQSNGTKIGVLVPLSQEQR